MALSQAVEGIQGEFGISDVQMSLLPFSMALLGALGAIPIGILSDRVRRTWPLAAAMAIWTVATGLLALSTTAAALTGTAHGIWARWRRTHPPRSP
ncbi:MAG: hypothetical protein U5K56_20925 [Halioglobus sp.]|nr:hypothetical protein [Halioglobus sp.]